jgi:hypothetical protein
MRLKECANPRILQRRLEFYLGHSTCRGTFQEAPVRYLRRAGVPDFSVSFSILQIRVTAQINKPTPADIATNSGAQRPTLYLEIVFAWQLAAFKLEKLV